MALVIIDVITSNDKDFQNADASNPRPHIINDDQILGAYPVNDEQFRIQLKNGNHIDVRGEFHKFAH